MSYRAVLTPRLLGWAMSADPHAPTPVLGIGAFVAGAATPAAVCVPDGATA